MTHKFSRPISIQFNKELGGEFFLKNQTIFSFGDDLVILITINISLDYVLIIQ